MGLLLGAIADDYTGASDLANTLTRNGLSTIQTIGAPRSGLSLPEVDAIVTALKIRSVESDRAVEAALAACAWLETRGVRHVMYKICSTFDSTDAGNIGPVTDALRASLNAGITLVTPAFPETGRTVFFGHLFVGSVPLNESPLKDHPLNPMTDANLVRVLARQSKAPVGVIDLLTVANGPQAIEARLDALEAAAYGAAIVDAVFERDLEAIGKVAARRRLSTGASGLGLGLARELARSRNAPRTGAPNPPLEPVGGRCAVVAGSCSRATLEQVAFAEARMPVLRIEPEKLIDDHAEVDRALAWAEQRLAAGPIAIATSSEPDQVAALQRKYGREASGKAIEERLARMTAGLVDRGVRRLIIAGGETSGAVVDRLKIPAFLVGPEIAPGVPLMRTVGHARGELQMALKSGNFGGRDFFAKALALTN